ncbi:Rieske (2Fe-2S) protein [soil metagenome]
MKRLESLPLIAVPCSRRSVLQAVAAAGLGGLLASVGCSNSTDPGADLPMGAATSCSGGQCLDLTDPVNAPLTASGGALVIPTADDIVMVIRISDTQLLAVSAICTHRGCELAYDVAGNKLVCPCHGSEFDATGAVTKGPAVRPIKVYTAVLANGVVTIG